MKHSSFMAMVKGEKAMRFVLKSHLFVFYNSYVVLLEVNGDFPLCINLKKNNDLEEHNNCLAK